MADIFILSCFILAIMLEWLLVLRIVAALLKLDPYHPLIQFLFRVTNTYIAPFRFGIFRRPSKVDLAVIPPMLILAIIIGFTGANL